MAALIFMIAISAAGAALDLRDGRIPNALTLLGMAAGCAFKAASGGLAGAGEALSGAALPFAFGILLFALGMVGAGDVKLLMALCAFTGLGDAPKLLACVLAAAGAASLFILVFRAGVKERAKYFAGYLRSALAFGDWGGYRGEGCGGAELRLAPAVFIGTAAFAVLKAGGWA